MVPCFSKTTITTFRISTMTGRKTQRKGERQMEREAESKEGIKPRYGKRVTLIFA